MASTLYYSTTLTVLDCGACGIPFAAPESRVKDWKQTGDWFYCPNGDRIGYGKDENTLLKREKDQIQARLNRQIQRTADVIEERDHAERRRRSTRAVLTKTKKRVAEGACPCCSKRFADVKAHMAEAHPTYADVER